MTAEQLTLDDCEPAWTDSDPSERTPTPFDLRQTEMRDLRGQDADPFQLWAAHTVPTGRYL